MAEIHPQLKVAVVGSGPSGCYLAQGLLRALSTATITIFDRLASPYGLIRYGVAADHQHTKAISRQFERLFASPQVTFAGNVDVGKEVSLDDLRTHFDVVVLATGLSQDRGLQLPGSTLSGVFGAGEIVQTLNSHPTDSAPFPDLHGRVVIIGSGNVAIDILRFLVKGRDDYAGSDISDESLEIYLGNPATEITVASRATAAFAKSDPQMLRELATLPRGRYFSPDLALSESPEDDRQATARLHAYEELTSVARPVHPGPTVHLRFGVVPIRIVGEDRVSSVEFQTSEEIVSVAADSVITAIGFESSFVDNEIAALTQTASTSGRVSAGLYRTGWAKRGPRGAIPENRACAKSVVDEILEDLANNLIDVTPNRQGLAGLPHEVRESAVSYEEWLKIDRLEQATAAQDRSRQKTPSHSDMVAIAKHQETHLVQP